MTEPPFKLRNAPIIEAVLDIDCDMPPKYSVLEIEAAATAAFKDHYPKHRKQFMQEFKMEAKLNGPPSQSLTQNVQSLQFLKPNDKQLVQVRSTGFSFNRLAPYESFDDYAPEIEKMFGVFIALTKPVQMRAIRLRYINRILLPPSTGSRVNLDEYLRIGPRLPDGQKLMFTGFLNQHSMLEVATGNKANVVLTTQPFEGGKLPVIFDVTVEASCKEAPSNWAFFVATVRGLRDLKNSIFKDTLTEKCLTLFR